MTLHFSPEIEQAFRKKAPIVALESTIISHGMPFPQNLEVANEVENVVRENGSVPATIAILNGEIHVGLSAKELEWFAQQQGVLKCSRRDLPFAVSKKLNGATTVAATMIIAKMAGIKVFATGGIGGVHRGAESTLDISADLQEFAQTNVVVVSAGAKAILDLPKTLEYLETAGVSVIGYGTDEFPAFYYRNSGLRLPMKLNSAMEIAAFVHSKNELGLEGGVLIANPIPPEAELDAASIELHIDHAITEAMKQDISGKELTPFLLKMLNTVTSGKSQAANRALVLNNAKVAAQIAAAL